MSRLALVIGASRGLGLGLTRELSARGWRVTATARQPQSAAALSALSRESSDAVSVETLDMLAPAQLTSLAARLEDHTLDLLVINAGISGRAEQAVDTATPAELSEIMMTNAIAPLLVARRLAAKVKAGGTVAFMSSRMGSIALNLTGGMELYRASKAALNSLTRGYVATLAGEHSLHVLTLHPGWVRTDMGGPEAPLSIEESVHGLANVLESPRTQPHQFLDYQGHELPW